MPQFDKITFFNQIFWLFFFFSASHSIFLKFYLPALSSVLKARVKKLQKGTQGLFTFFDEQSKIRDFFNLFLEEISHVVKTSVAESNDKVHSSLRKDLTLKSIRMDLSVDTRIKTRSGIFEAILRYEHTLHAPNLSN